MHGLIDRAAYGARGSIGADVGHQTNIGKATVTATDNMVALGSMD